MSNRKGFTLIELLAVITIMGILMLVAIPAVSRTIENTRRQTFANTALQYIKSFKNEVYQDQVKCYDKNFNNVSPSALSPGYYYYMFDSGDSSGRDLMEQGGTSSWGGAQVRGVIAFYKPYETNYDTGELRNQKADIEYAIFMTDSVGRGIGTAGLINYYQSNSNGFSSVSNNYQPWYMITESSLTRSSVGAKTKAESWDGQNYSYSDSSYDNRKKWYDRYNVSYSHPGGYYSSYSNSQYTHFTGTSYSRNNNIYYTYNENGTNYSTWRRCSLNS